MSPDSPKWVRRSSTAHPQAVDRSRTCVGSREPDSRSTRVPDRSATTAASGRAPERVRRIRAHCLEEKSLVPVRIGPEPTDIVVSSELLGRDSQRHRGTASSPRAEWDSNPRCGSIKSRVPHPGRGLRPTAVLSGVPRVRQRRRTDSNRHRTGNSRAPYQLATPTNGRFWIRTDDPRVVLVVESSGYLVPHR